MAEPSTLTSGAACMDCGVPKGLRGAVQIVLLQEMAGNTETPAELMESAKCFECIPAGMRKAVIIYLLNVLNGGASALNFMAIDSGSNWLWSAGNQIQW